MFYQEVFMSKIDSKLALGGVSQNRCFVKKAFFYGKPQIQVSASNDNKWSLTPNRPLFPAF